MEKNGKKDLENEKINNVSNCLAFEDYVIHYTLIKNKSNLDVLHNFLRII